MHFFDAVGVGAGRKAIRGAAAGFPAEGIVRRFRFAPTGQGGAGRRTGLGAAPGPGLDRGAARKFRYSCIHQLFVVAFSATLLQQTKRDDDHSQGVPSCTWPRSLEYGR